MLRHTGVVALCCICLWSIGPLAVASGQSGASEDYVFLDLSAACRQSPTPSQLEQHRFIRLSARSTGSATAASTPRRSVAQLLARERPPLLRHVPVLDARGEAILLCDMLYRKGFAEGYIAILATPAIDEENWTPARILMASEVASLLREGDRRYRLLSVEPELQRLLPPHLEYENDPGNLPEKLNDVIITSSIIISHPDLTSRLTDSSIILHGDYTALYLALISVGGDRGSMPLVCR